MNETHLEHPDVQAAIDELGEAVGQLTTEQELRQIALEGAIRVFLKPGNDHYTNIIAIAEEFYKFLSAADSND